MSMHTRLLLLGLLASLGGAGQATDSPFLLGSDSGLQVAVRVIPDKQKESNSTNDEPEVVVHPELPPADSEAEDQETTKKPEEGTDPASVPTETSSGTSILDWLQILLGFEKDAEPAGQEPADESKEASVLPDETGNEGREPAGQLDKETVSGKSGSEAEAESTPWISEQGTEDESREASTAAEGSASGDEQRPEPSHTSATPPPKKNFFDWLSILFETNEDSGSASQTPARESKEASASSGEAGDKSDFPVGRANGKSDSDRPNVAKGDEKGSGEIGRESASGPKRASASSGESGNEGDRPTGQTDGQAGSDKSDIAKGNKPESGQTGQESADGSKEASIPVEDSGPDGENGESTGQSAQETGSSRAPVAASSGKGVFDWLSVLFGADEDSTPADATSADKSKETSASSGEAGDKSDIPSGQTDGQADSDEPALAQETGKDAKPAGRPTANGAAEATIPSAETKGGASQSTGRMEKKTGSGGAGVAQKPGKAPGTAERESAGGPKSASIPSGNAGRTAVPGIPGATEKPGEAPKPAEQASSGELKGGSVSLGEAGNKGGQPTVQVPGMPSLGQPGVVDATVGEPSLAGQASRGETREMILSRAEAVLNRVDQILLDARARARQEREGRGDNGGTRLENDSQTGGTQSESEGEFVEEGAERGGIAEGQVPGNVPTGKARPTHGYEEDDDIVTRQVCELAKRERDPEVRKQLEKKCKSLRDS